MFMLKFILEQMALYWAVYKKCFLLMKTFLKRLSIWQILHVIHFICDKSIQTAREHLYREQKEFNSAPEYKRLLSSARRCMKSNTSID